MKLSVVIPAFNRATLLPLTLKSLFNQTIPADEIIVIDDGSTDNTAEVAESFGNRVTVLRQENMGPAAARNHGFRHARGEFIHFFDSDDLALPNKHEVQLKALLESSADIAYGPWVKGEITANGFHPEDFVLQQHGLPTGNLIKALLCNWSIVPHACLFRRSIIEKIDGFPEQLFVGEDQLMFLRCLLNGAKIVHSPETLELYRTNAQNKLTLQPNSASSRKTRDWARFLVLAFNECKEHGIDPSLWFGFRQRAWEAYQDVCDFEDEPLLTDLARIFRHRTTVPSYRIIRFLLQKWGGINARTKGTRLQSSFRHGRFTQTQTQLIATMYFA